jgi:hypothetical protein
VSSGSADEVDAINLIGRTGRHLTRQCVVISQRTFRLLSITV